MYQQQKSPILAYIALGHVFFTLIGSLAYIFSLLGKSHLYLLIASSIFMLVSVSLSLFGIYYFLIYDLMLGEVISMRLAEGQMFVQALYQTLLGWIFLSRDLGQVIVLTAVIISLFLNFLRYASLRSFLRIFTFNLDNIKKYLYFIIAFETCALLPIVIPGVIYSILLLPIASFYLYKLYQAEDMILTGEVSIYKLAENTKV